MTGLALAREYYEQYGRPMIRNDFPEYEDRIAVGLVGEGSECFGFDDEISRDHDFGPAFCMWLEKDDFAAVGEKLQKAYENLPDCYKGFSVHRDSRLSGHRTGVWETGDFYRHFLMMPGVPQSLEHWLRLPDSYLAVAVNGEVFRDDAGTFSKIRRELLLGYPEDIRIKKMVARSAGIAQSGQYNYVRCMKRNDTVAGKLALAEFLKNGMSMIYLLNNRYAPFYKWMHRGMEKLEILGDTRFLFAEAADETRSWKETADIIEEICQSIVNELKRQGLTKSADPFLQMHLDSMMQHIRNEEIRQLHWLEG